MSLELGSQHPHNAKVQDLACAGTLKRHPGIVDPELGQCDFVKLQKSGSQAQHAIRGLRIINKATITANQKWWEQVEAWFHKLANSDNLLHQSHFAECIGEWSLSLCTKIIAGGIVAGVLVHVLCHVTCDFPRIINAVDDDYYKMPVGYTGIAMVILMTIAYLLANHRFRRNLVKLPWPFHRLTRFNAFWYSHHLFIIVYILLLVH
uniref:Ferric oxidoreductase domain-containing protein n=1 Tax=Physcomitrium patens TaxID=3218 RepID=A0A2K1IYY9_PHYPA|nr:hypothetical protein PHYPA_024306 [Physcomitrium patens]